MIKLKKVLVALDLADPDSVVLELGQSIAAAFGAELHLLHVVADPLSETWAGYTPGSELLDVLERRQIEARVRLERLVSENEMPQGRVVAARWGVPADEILKYASSQNIDLIVCGTHGRRGWDHVIIGSVAERVLRQAACPVLTVARTRTGRAVPLESQTHRIEVSSPCSE